ncbi:DnaJ C-terminal domain-containing protein [Kushneria phosphatilytica]|uniref:DnaJ domain-containing protein n=1 Tax=Kushneria phosphatilytica TaxID=657387 RepID=A0A1S1NVW9_9GAMM|nr:DnaJ C-terminal domain-containing protein [Kushneria phosphatilytica]OHV09176.1 cytochrome C biogenesis protein [Kushneria phosphatilytica]QEL12329.1 DnaJ domain-containing protein [Kushneria phosphatilytica]
MEFRDYYQLLGVERTATPEEIKKAYRRLARRYHPDINREADAEQRMQEINEARDVLADPERRAAYDQLYEYQHHGGGEEFRAPPDWDAGFEFSGSGFSNADAGDYSDFFASIFGHPGGRRSRGSHYRMRGEDRHARIYIDLVDTYQGATRTIVLHSPEPDATGQLHLVDHNLSVHIPRGVKSGQHIRLSGQGHPGMGGGPPGDLFLEIAFNEDSRYRIEDRDVYTSVPVAPWEAALGASIEAPTPSGPVRLKVPAGSQSGRRLRLKGRGIPGEPAGDLYVELRVVLPPANSERARQFYQTMAQEMPFNPRQSQET